MTNEEKTIYVYDSFSSEDSKLIGRLFVNQIKGGESYAFEFDKEWLLANHYSSSLDPELFHFSGRQYPSSNMIFGLFADSSPDRWGRLLMTKKERMTAISENRKPRKLNASDYLLGVYDKTRMGGLRFKLNPEGEFCSDDESSAIPPWTTLRTLEEASRQLENDDVVPDEKWLNQLLKPGSSLGGARPKATISDPQGQLWIAKFPSKHDENDTGAWEKVVHDLARMCGLRVPESKLEKFSDLGSTFLVKRFDRIGNKRIHFASAMTLLNKVDGASAEDGSTYLDLVSIIKSNGANPSEDLLELWKRIVFNMAVSNTDDHLRNHAFIYQPNGWVLSPLYDVNPIPYGDELSLNINETDNRISISLAIDSAHYYGISRKDANIIAHQILDTVKNNWENLAIQYKIPRAKIEDMRPAFSTSYESF